MSDDITDLETIVDRINDTLLQAAEPCKVVHKQPCPRKRAGTIRTHHSPWYNSECEMKRKLYKGLCNEYGGTKDDVVKRRRDAKDQYVKLCKSKSKQHERQQTKKY